MYQLFKSQRYQQYMKDYQIPSVLAKVFDWMHIDDQSYQRLFSKEPMYHDFSLFSESEEVLERIHEALDQDEKICIYGDYDCDGIMATTILVYAFECLGKKVGYHIPDRQKDGYGLPVQRVEEMADKGYSLIITVDNGIKAFEAIERANELGVDVIVSDHHQYDEELPDAFAILHTRLSLDYPFKEICGAMIAYKLAYALLSKEDPYLKCLAALATISDMMPLLDENRCLVKEAIDLLNEHHYTCFDLLLGTQKKYQASNLAYTLAPKINAFGRLPEYIQPVHVVRYFLCQLHPQPEWMIKFASEAQRINTLRQELTQKQYDRLVQQIHQDEPMIFVSSKEVHEGLVGLIGAKMNREFQKVAFVMHEDEKTHIHKGSVRSLEGFKVGEVLEKLSSYLEAYGGHDLAGGLSVKDENLAAFKKALMKIYHEKESDIQKEDIKTVIDLDLNEISLTQVEALSCLEPYGQKVEEPLFVFRDVPVSRIYTLSQGKHLKIELENHDMNALFFNHGQQLNQFKGAKKMTLVGTLSINHYLNQVSISLLLKDIL